MLQKVPSCQRVLFTKQARYIYLKQSSCLSDGRQVVGYELITLRARCKRKPRNLISTKYKKIKQNGSIQYPRKQITARSNLRCILTTLFIQLHIILSLCTKKMRHIRIYLSSQTCKQVDTTAKSSNKKQQGAYFCYKLRVSRNEENVEAAMALMQYTNTT